MRAGRIAADWPFSPSYDSLRIIFPAAAPPAILTRAAMPVRRGADAAGPYYAFGAHGKRYHYPAGNARLRAAAYALAARQGRAIEASKRRR